MLLASKSEKGSGHCIQAIPSKNGFCRSQGFVVGGRAVSIIMLAALGFVSFPVSAAIYA